MVSGCLRDAMGDVPLGLMIIFDIFRPCKQFLLGTNSCFYMGVSNLLKSSHSPKHTHICMHRKAVGQITIRHTRGVNPIEAKLQGLGKGVCFRSKRLNMICGNFYRLRPLTPLCLFNRF